MTYNVFGGTLNPAQSNPICSEVKFLCLYPISSRWNKWLWHESMLKPQLI